MKTRDLAPTGSFHLLALGTEPGGRQLTFHEGGLEPTQDWKQDRRRLQQPGPARGQPLRRLLGRGKGHALDRRPRSSKSWRWSTSCGARAARSRSSRPTARRPTRKAATSSRSPIPSSARFPGRASTSSTTPAPPSGITAGSRIKSGDRLRVSWYHPIITHGSQVMCCLSEPKLEQDPARPGPAGQRAVPPQDVLHVAR